jgi:lipopolysaccharide transport system ATP-binding protein
VGRSRILVLASHSPQLIKSICNKAALLQAGRVVAMGTVDEIFDRYRAGAHLPPAIADEASVQVGEQRGKRQAGELPASEQGPYGNDLARYLGASVETLDGIVCEELPIHQPFRISLRFRLLRGSPVAIVPNFHFFDWKGDAILSSLPAESAPTAAGEYVAHCIIDPYIFNVGHYSVSIALSSMELPQPVHFHMEHALHFEMTEPFGIDPRRHGYVGPISGITRIRLAWRISETQQSTAA